MAAAIFDTQTDLFDSSDYWLNNVLNFRDPHPLLHYAHHASLADWAINMTLTYACCIFQYGFK